MNIKKSSPPSPRRGHSATMVDPYMVVFGGCFMETKCFNDLYFFDIVQKTWMTVPTSGDIPSPRQGHGAVLYGSTLWVFGGSSNLGYFNDLYTLNLETRTWTKQDFQGKAPSARANFGMIANSNGKLVIFGGYTDIGYDNNIYMLNILDKRYERPLVIGKPPSSRQNFGFLLYKDIIYVYGGFNDVGPQNDFYSLDLNNWMWKNLTVSGTIPPKVTGSIVTRVGNKMIAVGGCIKEKESCYNDTYLLNLDTLSWTKVTNSLSKLSSLQFASIAFFRSSLYLFGGCEMYKQCFNNMYIMNVDDECPLNCSSHGTCKKELGCACTMPFIEHDCSIEIRCKEDCNEHGKCHSNGKCGCFPGWGGDLCNSGIPCSNNCTSETNGICQPDSTCKCNPNYSGQSCENKKGQKGFDTFKNLIKTNQDKLNKQEKKN